MKTYIRSLALVLIALLSFSVFAEETAGEKAESSTRSAKKKTKKAWRKTKKDVRDATGNSSLKEDVKDAAKNTGDSIEDTTKTLKNKAD